MKKIELVVAMERLLVAIDTQPDGFEGMDESMWLAYEKARVLLGDPVKMYPGGYENEHFHAYGWKEADGCGACEDYREEQAVVVAT